MFKLCLMPDPRRNYDGLASMKYPDVQFIPTEERSKRSGTMSTTMIATTLGIVRRQRNMTRPACGMGEMGKADKIFAPKRIECCQGPRVGDNSGRFPTASLATP
jgi:hypothetical protein